MSIEVSADNIILHIIKPKNGERKGLVLIEERRGCVAILVNQKPNTHITHPVASARCVRFGKFYILLCGRVFTKFLLVVPLADDPNIQTDPINVSMM